MASREEPIERKVQLTGGSTYTVSLPKEWAGHQDIEAGSTVELYARDDRLLITNEQSDEDRQTAVIDAVGREPPDLARTTAAAYVAGSETIRIEGSPDSKQRRAIRDAVAGLVGIEIHAEDEESITARTMLDVDDLSPEQTLVQMELTSLSMHEDAIEAVLTGDGELARRVIRQDDDIDRLFGLISREFQQSLVDVRVSQLGDGLTTFEYYSAARQLERVGDHAEKIASVADRMSTTPPEDVADELEVIGERARDIVQRSRSALLDGEDPSTLGAIVTDAEAVIEDANELDRELYERELEEGYLLGTVTDSIVRTTEYGVNLVEAGLQATMRESE
jgi:phosphate uptake regulator